MARKVERRAGQHITQLSFDSLAEIPAHDARTVLPRATSNNGEVHRYAPPGRKKAKKSPALPGGIQQGTLDDLFATIPDDVDIPLTYTPRESRQNNGHLKQLDFDSL